MLTRLSITDFAIIDHLDLDFDSGLVILTGETGAGKSILLDAIQALIGGPVDPTMVRSGASKARLEAVIQYDVDQSELVEILEREDLMEEPGQVLLEREIRVEGRSTGRVNGHVTSQAVLREIGAQLIDIHGQSEHLSLLNTRSHLGLLDRYAQNELHLKSYQSVYHRITAIRKDLNELARLEKENQSRQELLQFQLDEIQNARLIPGEEDELDQERTRLANAENLAGLTREILALLDEAPPDSPSISDLLGQVSHQLGALVRVDPSQHKLSENADTILELSQDLAAQIRDYADQIEYNPHRLEEVEERLELIHHLSRKYGGSVEAVLAHAANNLKILERITHAADQIADLQQQESLLMDELVGLASALTRTRQAASTRLSEAVETELNQLQMSGARFMVEMKFDYLDSGLPIDGQSPVRFDANGVDQVEFLIAPNPGEGFKPLVKIASGGETSRLMLALKNVLAKEDQIPTLIFDEIDQGIGGRVGKVVGKKLWQLSRFHQVFCVTHLPQLAAYGNEHFLVTKQIQDNRTGTRVILLEGEARVEELAQMLGTGNSSTLQSARDLLKEVQKEVQPVP